MDLNFEAALIGVCIERDGGPWDLLSEVGRETQWSEATLLSAMSSLGYSSDSLRSCTQSLQTENRVWSDVFDAARRGVTGTPTFYVDERVVAGGVSLEPLVSLIQSRIEAKSPVSGQ